MARYTIPVRLPDRAYLDGWLWLPKSVVNPNVLRYSLTFPAAEERSIVLWRESEHHFAVPRGHLKLDQLPYEVVDLRPKCYQAAPMHSLIELDALDPTSTEQRDAYDDLREAKQGVLNLSCGKGKTCILLHAIAERGAPALVINDKTNILLQWAGEITGDDEAPPKLELGGPLGWIQGKPDTWRWRECPITFASLRTLSMYVDSITPEMAAHFGIVVWDELHHLGAPSYAATANIFLGDRLGATATLNRPDGLELVYLWHIGPVFHCNLTQDLVPTVTVVRSPTYIDLNSPTVRAEIETISAELHHRKLCAYVGTRPEELDFVTDLVQQRVQAGREVLAITVSKPHARLLHERFPGSGVLDAQVVDTDRLAQLHQHRLVFATVDMAKEALNKRKLDCLMILTEFSSDNNLQQAVGRVQRLCEGKRTPEVVLVLHDRIPPLRAMGEKLRRHLRKRGMTA